MAHRSSTSNRCSTPISCAAEVPLRCREKNCGETEHCGKTMGLLRLHDTVAVYSDRPQCRTNLHSAPAVAARRAAHQGTTDTRAGGDAVDSSRLQCLQDARASRRSLQPLESARSIRPRRLRPAAARARDRDAAHGLAVPVRVRMGAARTHRPSTASPRVPRQQVGRISTVRCCGWSTSCATTR
jgi:hypothetical protein